MSQQGGSPTGHDDDWWGQLYDDTTGDTGPAAAADSLDDRFASAAGAVTETDGPPADGTGGATGSPAPGERPPRTPHTTNGVPAPRAANGVPAPRAADPRIPAGSTGEPGGSAGRTGDSADVSYGSGDPVGAAPDAGGSVGVSPRAGDPAAPPRAPWEGPRAAPAGPVTFPPSPAPGTPDTPPGAPSRPAGTPAAHVPAARRPPDPRTSPPPPPPPPSFPLRTPAPPESPSPASGQDAPEAPGEPPIDQPPPAPGDGRAAGRAAVVPPPSPDYVGSGPPTYDPEPTALPAADPDGLDDLIPDTVLDGARYGTCTLRALSLRGDSPRFRGERRRDALLTARFGTGDQALIVVAMATGARAAPGAHRAAADLCRWIGRAVGRSHLQLLADVRAGRRGDLKAGLHRLTDRSLGKLRADAAEQDLAPDTYTATLRCLLLPGDPDCRTRVFFGVGAGGLFRLRDGTWQDLEPDAAGVTGTPAAGYGPPPDRTPEGDRPTPDPDLATPPAPHGEPAGTPPREPFRFRVSLARPGDVLLMCTAGLAEPLRGEDELREHLARRWSGPTPPGLAAFLADARVRVKGYADDRTAAAVWEA
ncbi:protein phosphatase 2C domain-containing protein [Streptomyces sp. NPDC052020]|uniref:protein phosphatase 2C domain-containing protein n=1 Tax=Streptomyces sp. NPDC052020 TaxID=3155677 RepID=UPI00342CFA9F